MRVVISGYYGYGNAGDEAVLEAIILQLREHEPSIEITVLSANPSITSQDFNVESVKRFSPLKVIRAIRKCDLLISGGGSLLQDVTGKFTLSYYLGIIKIARRFGKKYVILGQGYGPIHKKSNEKKIRRLLNGASLITLRDDQALKDLKSIGVKNKHMFLCADPTFVLDIPDVAQLLQMECISKEKPLIGVSIRAIKNFAGNYHKSLALVLDKCIELYNANVVFIPFHEPSDRIESLRVISKMKNKPIMLEGEYEHKALLGVISNLNVLIGVRLHSLIFSAISAVPFIAIDYDPKVKSLSADFGAKLLTPDFTAEKFLEAFDQTWKNRNDISQNIKEKIRIKKQQAKANFEKLFELSYRKKINLFGVQIDNINYKNAILKIDEFIMSKRPHIVFTPNPEIIIAAQKDEELRSVLNDANLAIPDGIGIVIVSRLLNNPVQERVTGIDLMIKMLDLAKENRYKVFLLGSAPGVAKEAAARLVGVNVVGVHDGYFKEEDDDTIIKMIKSTSPDMLFVGLGAPRQEKWLHRNFKNLGVPVSMVIGGSMDVISGRVARSPEIFIKLNLEWLYRLFIDPKRWRRQLKLVVFLFMGLKERFKKK